jgi:adenosylmethionine-8-amino-7-oxononanoate aminotransferase
MKPPPGSSVALRAVDLAKAAHAEQSVRAASAHLLAPVVSNEVVWQVRASGACGLDAVLECRRAIDEAQARAPEQGVAVRAHFASNGMVLGPLAGMRRTGCPACTTTHTLPRIPSRKHGVRLPNAPLRRRAACE